MLTPCVAFTSSATCEAVPGNPTLSRGTVIIGSTAITGPVVVDVNQTVTIRCRAENTDETGTLKALYWRFNNGSRIQPVVGKGVVPDYDVYVQRNTGQSGTLFRVLHFKRIHPSSAGIYVCIANYGGVQRNQSMEIQVSGV